jgi:aryl-alcohol dehydrogenase-like predicted oxidoreductase
MQFAIIWLLQRSPSLLVIPRTSSIDNMRENLGPAELASPASALAVLVGLTRRSPLKIYGELREICFVGNAVEYKHWS